MTNSSARVYQIVILIYLLINLIYLGFEGVWRSVDTTRYLQQSEALLGSEVQEVAYYYFSYIVFVALIKLLGLPHFIIGVIQIVISTIAVYILGKVVVKNSQSYQLATLSIFLLLIFFNFWKWNTTIMTESLYCSLSLFWLYSLLYYRENKSHIIISWVIILILVFTRPNGWMLFLIHLLWLTKGIIKFTKKTIFISVCISIIFLTITFLLPFTQKMINQQSLIHWQYGTVIWGYWEWHYPLYDSQITFNFATFFKVIKLILLRVALEVSGIRPYFSTSHNIIVSFYMLVIHLLALSSVFYQKRNDLQNLSLFVFLGQFLIVAATFADWEGRFAYQVLPFTVILASFQFMRITEYFKLSVFNLHNKIS